MLYSSQSRSAIFLEIEKGLEFFDDFAFLKNSGVTKALIFGSIILGNNLHNKNDNFC